MNQMQPVGHQFETSGGGRVGMDTWLWVSCRGIMWIYLKPHQFGLDEK